MRTGKDDYYAERERLLSNLLKEPEPKVMGADCAMMTDKDLLDKLNSVVTEVKELRKICAEQAGNVAKLTQENDHLKQRYAELHSEMQTQLAFARERGSYL